MRRASFLIAVLLGCGGPESGPVPISLGEDSCDACRMIINEAPFAAQIRLGPSKVERFDDLGCLAERLAAGPEPVEIWVTDRLGGGWIDGRSALYLQFKDLKTPMASGLVAFESETDLKAFIGHDQGRILRFDQLKETRRPPR